jgi:hypothetical protein
MKIGVMVESFRAGLDGGLAAAAELGVSGVQMYASQSETHFEKLLGKRIVAVHEAHSSCRKPLAPETGRKGTPRSIGKNSLVPCGNNYERHLYRSLQTTTTLGMVRDRNGISGGACKVRLTGQRGEE